MGTEGLKIVIGADMSGAVGAINKLTDSLAGVAPAGTKAANGLNRVPQAFRELAAANDRMRTGLRDAASGFPNFTKSANVAADALKNVVPGANQAGQALINVGRVAQDLPFGFIGIQNNLNPLLESFQRLKAETGSSKAALKALGSSLIGAGGIGLALSVVSSAFLIFGNSMGGAKKELEGFDKALQDSNKKAGDEIARVQVLNAVITDNTRTQKERKGAAKELSEILKDLNINLNQEAILNGKVKEATEQATAAIISRAKARAAEARIGELSGQQLQRDLNRVEVTDKLAKAEKDRANQLKIQEQIAKSGGSLQGQGGNQTADAIRISNLKTSIEDLDKETAKANKEIAFLINQIQDKDLKIDKGGGGEDKVVDQLKQRIAALKELQGLSGLDAKQQVELVQLEIKLVNRDGPKLGFSPAEIKEQSSAILEKAFPVKTFEYETIVNTRVNKLEISTVKDPAALTEDFKTDIAKAIGIDGKPLEIPAPPVTFTALDKELLKATEAFQESMKQHVGDATTVLSDALANIFSGEDIGSSLANAASGIMSIIGDILQQAGKNMILASTAVKVLTDALTKLFGPGGAAAGIAAGALLITTGALIKKIVPPQHKFAEGGIVTGPIIGQIGEMHKPEVVMPLDRLKALIGNGINNGSGNGLQMVPIINNEGLFLAMKRGERSAGRKF